MHSIIGNLTKYHLIIFLCIIGCNLFAQQELQSRNSIRVAASLNDKISVKVGHLRAYNVTDQFKNIFYQSGIQTKYEINKKWDIFGGVTFLSSPSSINTRIRTYATATYTTRIHNKLKWTNSVRLETNSKNDTRFRQRIGLSTRLSLRKRLDFLNLSPSISYTLFYNIGGKAIPYYNENNELLIRQSPDGFHRSRLKLNLNSKINRYLSVSLYYMNQQEFNFLTPDTRKMNVYDPKRKKILRPFNNFNAIGLSTQINLDYFLKN